MTGSQRVTFRNHNGRSSSYDMISIFSLRPPELLGVFRNPVDYFRYCHNEEKQMADEDIELALNPNPYHCSWIDCFGRRVKICELAIDDVSALIESNLTKLSNLTTPTEANAFEYNVNKAIGEMIRMQRTPA